MDTFDTNKNKGLLWDVLNKQNKFALLPDNCNHQQFFEKCFKQVVPTLSPSLSLIEKNKQFISKFIHSAGVANNQSRFQTTPTKKDITEEFNRVLSDKQHEFDNAIKLKKPNEIDFNETIHDEPISSGTIDDLLAAQLEKRNLDIPQIDATGDHHRNAVEWINGAGNNKHEVDTKPRVKSEGNGKRVSWEPEKKPVSILKGSGPPKKNGGAGVNGGAGEVVTMLNEILENQKYMINAIHDLQDRL